MRYFILYDKNGAVLGGCASKAKLTKKGYTEVSAKDYKRIMAENGFVVNVPVEKEEVTLVTETAEEAK